MNALFSIPFRIQSSFWLSSLVIAFMSSNFNIPLIAIWMGVIIVSITVHELGHALTAKAFGQKPTIELISFGGQTHYEKGLSSGRELIVTLAGPLAGLSLAFLCRMLFLEAGQAPLFMRAAFAIGYQINIFWTLLNLLPILPLDGGQVVRIVLEHFFGLRGLKVAFVLSTAIAALSAIAALFYNAWFLMSFFFFFAFESGRAFQSIRHLAPEDIGEERTEEMRIGVALLNSGDLKAAETHFQGMLERSKKRGPLFGEISLFLSEVYVKKGEPDFAFNVLKNAEGFLDHMGLERLMYLAYEENEYSYALNICSRLYREAPTGPLAFFAARLSARLGDSSQMNRWLDAARELEFEAIDLTLHDFDNMEKE